MDLDRPITKLKEERSRTSTKIFSRRITLIKFQLPSLTQCFSQLLSLKDLLPESLTKLVLLRTLLQSRDKKDRLKTIWPVELRTLMSLLVSNVFTTQLLRAVVPLISLLSKESRTKRSLSVSELKMTLPKMDKSTNRSMKLSLLRRETQNSFKRL